MKYFSPGNAVIIAPQNDVNSLVAFEWVFFSTLRCYIQEQPESLPLLMEK